MSKLDPIKRLTPAQQHFVEEWLIDHNGTRAYKCAYPNVKNDNVAAVNATNALNTPKIAGYIEMRQSEISAKYRIDQERVLEEESTIAFSNVVDLFNESGDISNLKALRYHRSPPFSRFYVITGF